MNRILKMAGIVVVVAGLSAGAYLKFAAQPANAASAANLNTATVQRGTLTATVSAAGNITAAQQVGLNFQQTGVVQKVNVQVGDQVKAGQVLAELDTTDLALQVQNAQANVKNAQDKLVQTQNPSTAQDIANARSVLVAAQANYSKLVAGPTQVDLAADQANVAGAQAAYNAALKTAGAGDNSLQVAAAAVESAQAAQQTAQAAYDKVKSNPSIGMMAQSTTLQQATIAYQSALASYQQLQATSASNANSTVQQAKSQLAAAQATLANLQNQVTQNDVIASQALVTQAQNSLDKLLAGSDAPTLDLAQTAVNQAQIALKQAQSALQQAQIVAPFDGVVTLVNVTPGQSSASASGSAAIQLSDLNHLEIVVNMAEVDVTRAKVGQTAQITLDALPNVQLDGKVTEISPAGTVTQGVVNYAVTVQLTNPPASVKSGMTTNLNVIIQQRDNVLMVPNRAVKAGAPVIATSAAPVTATITSAVPVTATGAAGGANGARSGGQNAGARAASGSSNAAAGGGTPRLPRQRYYVTVLRDGQQVQVSVQTGLSNDTMTEIVSGLNAGDVVVLNTTTTTTTRTNGGPSVGLPGVGRIGG
jgi:HlyD family secretion protein